MNREAELKRRKNQSKPAHELRTTLEGSRLEVREQNGNKRLTGYAVVFNSPADIGGDFTEIVSPGSFTQTLQEDDQVLLMDHESSLLIARKSAGNLKLSQDDIGVRFDATLPNTELARSVYELVRTGTLAGCSFGFTIPQGGDKWQQDSSGNLTRYLNTIKCWEVSLCTFPAYDTTSVDVRSIRAKMKADPDEDIDLDDSDDDDAELRCDCQCQECQDGDCDECSDEDCDDSDCTGCPNQDEERNDKLRTRSLFARRMTT